eukprot:5087835-Prymnesium_polylepis.1
MRERGRARAEGSVRSAGWDPDTPCDPRELPKPERLEELGPPDSARAGAEPSGPWTLSSTSSSREAAVTRGRAD